MITNDVKRALSTQTGRTVTLAFVAILLVAFGLGPVMNAKSDLLLGAPFAALAGLGYTYYRWIWIPFNRNKEDCGC